MLRSIASTTLRAARVTARMSTHSAPKAAPQASRALAAGVALGATAATAAFLYGDVVATADSLSLSSYFPDQESIYRRTAALQVQTSGKTNSAFVFIKPHAAASDKVKDLVRTQFKKNGIRITSEGSLDAKTIDENLLIDSHYGAIASKAMILDPTELNVPDKGKLAFEKKFGEKWDDVLAAGRVYNAKQACAKLGKWGTRTTIGIFVCFLTRYQGTRYHQIFTNCQSYISELCFWYFFFFFSLLHCSLFFLSRY